MLSRMKKLFVSYRNFLAYLFFGVMSTAVNIFLFGILIKFGLITFYANLFAWIITILFVYVTNRRWVFKSNRQTMQDVLKEFMVFLFCRLATGIIDQGIMIIGIDIIGQKFVKEENLFIYSIILKGFANIFVILCNYVFSKRIIFK